MVRRWILVTGSPRSGTTVVGRLLQKALSAPDLYEPLNFVTGDRVAKDYFEVPGSSTFSPDDFADFARRMQTGHLRLRRGLFESDSPLRRAVKTVAGSRTRITYRRYLLSRPSRPVVWKDPFAAFCVNSLVDHFDDIVPVVTFREPQAVAASFKRLGWGFNLPDLRSRILEAGYDCDPLPDLDYARPEYNGLGTWLLVYGWLTRYAPSTTLYVHNATVSQGDADGLRRISERLDIPVDLSRLIPPTPVLVTGDPPNSRSVHPRRRDIAAVNSYWSQLLDARTASLIRAETADLWQRLTALGHS